MSGLGRRTHYRKHLTDKVLHDLPVPASDECIAKVVATRGGNQFDIILPSTLDVPSEQDRPSHLAILPTKFRKLVWVKRNDYVIAQTTVDEEDGKKSPTEEAPQVESSTTTTGIKFIINHILYKEQLKYLKMMGHWPENDPEFPEPSVAEDDTAPAADDDGIVYNDNDGYYDEDEETEPNDDDLFVNTNRIAKLVVDDSSSDEDDD